MSKSLGNGIDPLEIINKYGADALRISMVIATPDGQDPWISKNTFEGGRNFVNKLHQVSRFVMMRLDGRSVYTSYDENDLVIFDKWILSRLERTIQSVNKSFDEYRLNAAAKTLHQFVWNDYCSWYIELIKPDQPSEKIREGSLKVACYVLDQILKLMHPFTPFVTEQIYLDMQGVDETSGKTITFGPWPSVGTSHIDDKLEESLELIQAVVTAVRSMRAELNVPPGKRSDLYIRVANSEIAELLKHHIDYFRSLAKIETLHCGTDVKKPPTSASNVISGAEIFLPLAGLIDLDIERARLQKELDHLKDLLDKISKKLANADFLQNAPGDIIDKEQAKKEDYLERIEKLNRNLEQVMGW
jgi:valyl-tRNA synthetase